MSVLRDYLDLPEQVRQGDFVVWLADGIEQPEQVLGSYVFTPGIVASLDSALGLIGNALANRQSHGAYVHGSFGSGKSHFMAVVRAQTRTSISAGSGSRKGRSTRSRRGRGWICS
jgi:hypothetical protein